MTNEKANESLRIDSEHIKKCKIQLCIISSSCSSLAIRTTYDTESKLLGRIKNKSFMFLWLFWYAVSINFLFILSDFV